MLEKVDLNKSVDKENYKKLREEMDVKLGELQRACKEEKIPVVIVFDGFGAGGKGTQINRLIQPLDPRGFDVYASRETGEEERMRPFLWRYWTKTPEDGRMMIFDKSWYDKVTVDRFDKETKRQELNGAFRDILSFEKQLADSGMILIKLFLYISRDEQKKRFKRLEESKETAWRVTEADWKRAYQEINEMEEHMANFGAVIVKFWIHIDKDEQERRFKERMEAPAKQWKITDEDWRNREKWDAYEQAVNEMLVRTSTTYAPWTIIEGNSKYFARVKVLETVVEAMEEKIREVKKLRK